MATAYGIPCLVKLHTEKGNTGLPSSPFPKFTHANGRMGSPGPAESGHMLLHYHGVALSDARFCLWSGCRPRWANIPRESRRRWTVKVCSSWVWVCVSLHT